MKKTLVAAVLILAVTLAGAINAQLGRLNLVARNSSGAPISGATVAIYMQGATANGTQSLTTGQTVTVYDLGSFAAGDSFTVNTGSTTYGISSITDDTHFVYSGPALNLATGDRLINVAGAGSEAWADAQGTVSAANPATTSSSGSIGVWIRGGYYDIIISKTGITSQLIQDEFVSAADTRYNLYPSSTNVKMVRLDSSRASTWSASDRLFAIGRAGTDEFSIDGVGGFHATGASDVSTGGLTVTAGGLTVSAGTTAVQALTATTGVFTSTANIQGIVTEDSTVRQKNQTSLASATAMTLTTGNYFSITGTTPITSMPTSSADNGRVVTLQFVTGAANMMVDGSNLNLNGNFGPAAGSTITLVGDGTNWNEVQRSCNMGITLITGATPSVLCGAVFSISQSGATNVTNFTNGTTGQLITILISDSNSTFVDNPGTMSLNGSANYSTAGAKDVLVLRHDGAEWVEVSRSNN